MRNSLKKSSLILGLCLLLASPTYSQQRISPDCNSTRFFLFGWNFLTIHRSACNNTDGVWDWGGNGSNRGGGGRNRPNMMPEST
ncbi:MAG: hypothetical protein K2Q03_03830 [Sphingobacteriaceae bacterium]|nr:hypothetical protein [Sphingobacteriaceae bacterium]